MDFNQALACVMLVCFVAGAADYALGGRFGLSVEFENGLMTCGRLLLCMGGFMVLAPVIARVLGPVVAPFFRSFGADPSIFAGMLLANDAGGAVLAMELADSQQAGQFSGLIVGAMLGTTVMLTIPTTMGLATQEERPSMIYGILCGIITLPLGCLAGGFAAGFPASVVLPNTVPVLALSIFLLIVLLFLGAKVVPAFSAFGKVITGISLFGLACGAAESLLGLHLLPGMNTLNNVFPVVGGIAIYLAGTFVLLAVVRCVLAVPLAAVGRWLKINSTSVSALILALANALPPIMMSHDMDERGRMLNIAFIVSAGCLLGDHLAFTAQITPELCAAVLVGKAAAGVTAFGAAFILAPKLLKYG